MSALDVRELCLLALGIGILVGLFVARLIINRAVEGVLRGRK